MITFPYGIWDFQKIVTQGFFYCDRTQAIPLLELMESSLFIRPRRFSDLSIILCHKKQENFSVE